jgi:hypothetical protein
MKAMLAYRRRMRRRSFFVLFGLSSALGGLTAALLAGEPAHAQGQAHADGQQRASIEAFEPCLYAYDPSRAGRPRFKDFPATVSTAKLRAPKIVGRDVRLFRTMIRDGSGAGVNFAGRFTIVAWGCGARCFDWAMVDRTTGEVIFDPSLRDVSTYNVDDRAPVDPGIERAGHGLLFRSDSKLLVLQGMPNEDEKRDGIAFLRWTGRRFVELKFIPAPTCRH